MYNFIICTYVYMQLCMYYVSVFTLWCFVCRMVQYSSAMMWGYYSRGFTLLQHHALIYNNYCSSYCRLMLCGATVVFLFNSVVPQWSSCFIVWYISSALMFQCVISVALLCCIIRPCRAMFASCCQHSCLLSAVFQVMLWKI